MKYLLALLSLTFTISLFGQYKYQDYDWGAPHKIPEVDSSIQKIILLNKKIVEYAFENDQFIQVNLNHTIEYLNSSEAVERNNRKYLPFSNQSIIVDPMARVIKPDGKVIELDESKILESTDEETGQHYKYFAFEGLETGSIVEYLYVLKTSPRYTGKQEYIQGEYPVDTYQFDLYCPPSIEFKFKTYNSDKEFIRDTLIKDQNHWSISFDTLPALKDEFQAPLDNLYLQFAYKLDSHGGDQDATAFGKASSNVYKEISTLEDKSDKKAIKKLLKESGVLNLETKDEQIFALEYYLKTNIRSLDLNGDDLSKPATIYKNKFASEAGLVKLYFHLLKALDISVEMVLTCDRTRYSFDGEFEAYHFLTDYLLYFPHSGKYLAPAEFAYRYGLIPYEFTDTDGLYIMEKSLGQFTTGVGKVKAIPPVPYEETYSDLDITLQLADDFNDVTMKTTSSSAGYYSVYIQPYLEMMNPDLYKEYVEGEIKRLLPEAEIVGYSVENAEGQTMGKKPLRIISELKNTGLIETAGPKYLVKIGEVIGAQFELYSESKRTLPVYSDHKRLYTRHIEMDIPKGYRIGNIGDLEIHTSFGDEDKPSLLFDSKAHVDNGKLIVEVEEYYDQLKFTPAEYEAYRKVINSASDFNKISLVLEPVN